jgi:predicted dehydrogenase
MKKKKTRKRKKLKKIVLGIIMIRFGIIGYGFMGKTHTTNLLKHPNAKVMAIFTQPAPNSLPPGVKLYTDDWKKLIDESEIDAVVIATPTGTHLDIAEYAAKKKKHLFVEKPMARTVEDCTRIINVAQENGVKLFVGHVLRFWPSYAAAKNALHNSDSEIGQVKMFRGTRYSAFPGWSEWFKSEKESGGCILDLSIHDIDFALWVMGSEPVDIYCEAKRLTEKGIDNWGVSMTTITFSQQQIAHCEASWAATSDFGFATSCEIIGTEGIIKFNSRDPAPVNQYGPSQIISSNPLAEDGYYFEMDAFIRCILENRKPDITGEDGRKAVAVCIAALKSATEERKVLMREVLLNE